MTCQNCKNSTATYCNNCMPNPNILGEWREKFNNKYAQGGLQHKGRWVQTEVIRFISELLSQQKQEDRKELVEEIEELRCTGCFDGIENPPCKCNLLLDRCIKIITKQ